MAFAHFQNSGSRSRFSVALLISDRNKANVDEEPRLAEAERIEVLPTLVLYRDGKAIGSIVAPDSKAMIDQFIRETLDK